MNNPVRGPWTGRLLAGRYEVQELIGRGGMADVYRGMDARLGRDVAIKVLKSTLNTDQASRDRFRQEAMSASQMAHPTVVRVFDAGDEPESREPGVVSPTTPYIVMEYVEGRLLSDIIRRGILDESSALGVTDGVLNALEVSHQAGIIHRDIKPANIMITRTGGVKVMDFGIARALAQQVTSAHQTSSILGTALYLSPEQARGEESDARSDLYSVGVVLYEMLAGRPPFEGESPVAVAYQHISGEVPPVRLQNPKVTPGTAKIVHTLLSKDPSERFRSATEVREALKKLPAPGAEPVEPPPAPRPTVVEQRTDEPPVVTSSIPQPSWQGNQEPSIDLPIPLGAGVQTASVPRLAIGLGSVLSIGMLIAIVIWLFTLNPATVVNAQAPMVPDLTEAPQETAVQTLTDLGLDPVVSEEISSQVDPGLVIETIPGPGVRVALGERVQVIVSAGATQVEVPNLVLRSSEEAIAELRAAGLTPGPLEEDYSPNLTAGTVLSMSPEPGERVNRGDQVVLTVSNGLVQVPDVVNRTVGEANPILSGPLLQLSVTLQADPTCIGQVVRSQSLAPGDHPQRSEITLVYCAGIDPNQPPPDANFDDG